MANIENKIGLGPIFTQRSLSDFKVTTNPLLTRSASLFEAMGKKAFFKDINYDQETTWFNRLAKDSLSM